MITPDRLRDINEPLIACTPDYLEERAKALENFRADILFGTDTDVGMDPESEQHYLLALSLMEQAQRHLKLAALKQVQAIAAPRSRR